MNASVLVSATHWPEADALFRADPRWLGGDDAYSIELAPGRVLWLFGDSFVGDGGALARSRAAFVHNAVAIQQGDDPSAATMSFALGSGPFFSAPQGTWFWPLHGALVGGSLLLFMMHVRSPAGGVGGVDEWRRLGSLGFFDVFGWAALRVANPHDDPRAWRVEQVALRDGPVVLGASVVVDDEWLYAFGWDRARHIVLARWPLERAATVEPEWWTGTGWDIDAAADAIVIEDGATEFTVHRDGVSWVQTQVVEASGALGMRRAERLQGPWSEPEIVFVPEEAARDDVFLYAGKAHPHLRGADLVLTYASIADADTTIADDTIYRPRFVAVRMERP